MWDSKNQDRKINEGENYMVFSILANEVKHIEYN